MKDKKEQKLDQEISDAIEEAACGLEEYEEPTQQQWREALETAVKQRDEYLSLAQRGAAEFANYKKRTEAARTEAMDDGVREAIAALLPTIDNFERAIQAARDAGECGALLDGLEMTQRIMLDTVQKLGMEEVPAEGQKFDPELHNAVMRADEGESGMILEVFQKGYRVRGKIIRYPMVKVAAE